MKEQHRTWQIIKAAFCIWSGNFYQETTIIRLAFDRTKTTSYIFASSKESQLAISLIPFGSKHLVTLSPSIKLHVKHKLENWEI